jgi:phage-related protein
MVVGEASVIIVPETAGFAAALDAESEGAFANFKKDAETAGDDAGTGLRAGVRDEAGKIEGDLGEVGANAGLAMRKGVEDGSKGVENDLGDLGAAAGVNLRKGVEGEASKLESDLGNVGNVAGGKLREGVKGETGKLADDMEKDGEEGGDRLSKGMGKGMEKLAGLISNTGLPLGGLSSKVDNAGKAMQDADGKVSGFSGTLSHLGGYALLGVGAGFAVAAVAGIKLAESMQTAEVSIANASGTGVNAAKAIGDAFLGTAFKSTFSGLEMAKAYAVVAAQLKSTEGHALSTGDAMKVMSAASDLAEAKQIDLGSATETVAKTMQVFGLKADEAAHASDVLYQGSEATKQSVESLGNQLAKMKSKLGETSGSIGQLTGLLVDMTNQHITGRAAVTGLSTGLNTLEKSAEATGTATRAQKSAFEALSPSLQALAKRYEDGSLTSKEFKKETEGLSPAQATLVASFTKASTAVQAAQSKYKELGVTAFDSQGKFVGMGSIIDQLAPKFQKMSKEQQLAAATTLFSAGAAKQMTAIIDAGPAAYNKATAAVEKHGAAEAAAKKQGETLKGEVERLGKGVEDLANRFGGVLIPVVTKLAKTLADTTVFVAQHKAAMIALAVVIGGPLVVAISAYVATVVSAAASSVAAFATIASGAELAEGQTLGATASMAAGWISSTAEAVTAAGATVASWVGIGDAAMAGGAATAAGIAIGTAGISLLVVGIVELASHWKEVWGDIKAVVSDAVSFIEGHWKLLLPILLGPFGLLIDGIVKFHTQITGVFTSIVNFITTAWTKVKASASELITSLVSFFSQLPGRLTGFFTTIVNFVIATWTRIRATAQELVNSVVTFFSALPGRIAGFFTTVGSDAQHVWDTIKRDVSTLVEDVIDYFKELPGRITSGISNLAGDVAKVWNQIGKGASGLIGEIVKFFSGLPGEVMGVVSKLPAEMLKLGEHMVEGVIHGFEKLAGSLLSAAEKTLLSPIEKVAKKLGISSPSKVTEKHGEAIVEGYATGMKKAAPKMEAAAADVSQTVLKWAKLAEEAAAKYHVSAALLLADIDAESSGDPLAKSSAGAQGLTQFMPGTAQEYGVKYGAGPAETRSQVFGQAKYLTDLGVQQDARLALEKYNGAPGSAESTSYATEVLGKESGYSHALGSGSKSSATNSTEQKAALDKQVAQQHQALAEWVAKTTASVADGTKAQKAAVAQEIADRKAMVAKEIADEKAGLTVQQAQQKVELQKQTSDQKAGNSVLDKMLEAIHSGSLKTLEKTLYTVHLDGLAKIEKDLDSDHKTALAKLSGELVKVHKEALEKQTALEVKATKEVDEKAAAAAAKVREANEKAAEKAAEEQVKAREASEKAAEEAANAQAAAITKATTIVSDEASNKTQEISDSTKVALDKQAEIGLSGTEAIAAHLQTVFDEVTQQGDKEIGVAKVAEDQAAGTGVIAEAEAARHLAEVENAAKIREAEAQSKEELAAKGNAASTTTTQTNAPINVYINGTGLSNAGIVAEIGWAAKIGTLPVAPPPTPITTPA